ncbi:lytic transglycosylase domain-containing protein [Bacillus toyonensis]|uniref:lytic transglycosylase domain-containing protein n=1 Tax=Bacillus toyonensis TaxID=155322 RepID=UPI002E1E8405|nr:lytic transglycosylase domain-containing protein [Bacillus toyonensis]
MKISDDIKLLNKTSNNENSESVTEPNDEQLEKFLEVVEAKAKELESNYKPDLNIFPQHDFQQIAYQQLVNEFQSSTNANNDGHNETSENENVENTTPPVNDAGTENTTEPSTQPPTSTNTAESGVIESQNLINKNTDTRLQVPSSDHLKQYSQFDPIINEMSNKYNVPFDLIKLVINTESSFNPNDVSHSGATGLMQLMPQTAEWLGVKNAYDPKQNIEGGTKYLSYLLKRYNNDLPLTLAAYNAGPGNVDKYKGIPPFQETQNYVKKILG